ncbi:plastocyanin/azurin family copper-binding protein [Polaribacter sp.]|uniref:plastocyanin/azurin family copper-binding protein n=1 Tax=Polaribacter sp. TaxID=1920175 RepID=UPI003F69D9B0
MKISKLISFLCVVFLVCCGKSEPKKEEKTQKISTEVNNDNVKKIVFTANDVMKFNRTKFTATANQKIILTLKHIGKLDKKIMGHNLVILKKDVNLIEFATKAALAKDNNYIPKNTNQVLVQTKMLGGGESDTIEFTAPAAGEYDFICSFPGHYGMMKGKFIVN